MTEIIPQGFLALPAVPNGCPVLVLHAWWGLNDTFKDYCLRLADAGFTTFAPDLYHGRIAADIPTAEAYVSDLQARTRQAEEEIAAAVRYLLEKTGASQGPLAVVGFSLGAYFALQLSCSLPQYVRRVVLYYGTGPTDFHLSKASYLAHFAENDIFEPAESVEVLATALRKAKRPAQFFQYPGTSHWFCEPDRPDSYNASVAELAWQRTLEFLSTTG